MIATEVCMLEVCQSLKIGMFGLIHTRGKDLSVHPGRLVELTHFGGRIQLDDLSKVLDAGIVNLIFIDEDKIHPMRVFLTKESTPGLVAFFVNTATTATATLPDQRTDRATA